MHTWYCTENPLILSNQNRNENKALNDHINN